jgi:hypothetical protein
MTTDDLDLVLDYIYVRVPALQSEDSIRKEVFGNNKNKPVSEMLVHLQQNKLVYKQQLFTEDDTANHIREQYSLTVAGIRFYQHAVVAGRPFFSKEKEQQRLQELKLASEQMPLKDVPKNYSLLDKIAGLFNIRRMRQAI